MRRTDSKREWWGGLQRTTAMVIAIPLSRRGRGGILHTAILPYCHRKLRVRHAKVIRKQFTFSSCQGLLLLLVLGFVVFEIARI